MNDNVLKPLLGWAQKLLSSWGQKGFAERFEQNWFHWFLILLLTGVLIDWTVAFFRVRPDLRIWEALHRFRQVMHGEEQEEEKINEFGYVTFVEEEENMTGEDVRPQEPSMFAEKREEEAKEQERDEKKEKAEKPVSQKEEDSPFDVYHPHHSNQSGVARAATKKGKMHAAKEDEKQTDEEKAKQQTSSKETIKVSPEKALEDTTKVNIIKAEPVKTDTVELEEMFDQRQPEDETAGQLTNRRNRRG